MTDFFGILATLLLLGLLLVAVGAVLGWRAFLRQDRILKQIRAIDARLQEIGGELDALRRGEAGAAETPQEQPEKPTEAPPEPPAEEAPEEAEPEAPEEAGEERAAPAPAAPAAGADLRGSLERSLTGRWMVWLGAVTLALGGAFLVQYTIEHDLIGPQARVALGLLLGVGLMGGGQAMRRSRWEAAMARAGGSYVPAALTAAGAAITYASIYSGFAFVAMYGPLVAFAGLALASAVTMLLALKQGAFVAALGLAGAYVTPWLVSPDAADAFRLFGYLTLVHAGALAVIRYRAWWWVTAMAVAAAVIWPTLWYATAYDPAQVPALAGYAVLLIAVPAAMLWRAVVAPAEPAESASTTAYALDIDLRALSLLGFAATAVVIGFATVRMGGYDGISLIAYLAIAAALAGLAWRAPRLWPLLALAAVAGLLLLATWHMGAIAPDYLNPPPDPNFDLPRVLAPELARFLLIASAWGAAVYLIGLAGAVLRARAEQAALWATVGASGTLVLLIAFWRVQGFETDLAWGAAGLGVAGLQVLGAYVAVERGRAAAIAPFAVSATAALALALAMSLERTWLTIALSLQVAALAWLQGWLRHRVLDWLAGVLAAVVLVRLVLNPYILDYEIDPTPILNWLLYGYGVPLAAFWASYWKFRELGPQDARAHPLLLQVLDGGRMALLVALVLLQANHWLNAGEIGLVDTGDLGEMAIYLVLAGALLLTPPFQPADGKPGVRTAIVWSLRAVWILVYAEVAVFTASPLTNDVAVGAMPLINLLGLAYALPAAMLGVFAWLNLEKSPRLAETAGLAALAVSLLYLTLEVRRAFVGSLMSLDALRPLGEAELWAYSVVWIVYALALMGLAFATRLRVLRFASLAVLLVAVVKVFVVDLAELEGIWRALSFLGLGLTLVGIGWVYQRFVFAPAASGSAKGGG